MRIHYMSCVSMHFTEMLKSYARDGFLCALIISFAFHPLLLC